MRSPEIKERNFLSKMFRTVSIYMIVALCSFFGYIMLFGDVSFTPTLPGNVDASEESNINKLLTAFTSANNLKGDINISVVGNDMDINVDIDADVDMKTFDFNVNIETSINDQEYLINAFKDSDVDSFLHLSVNDMAFKLDMDKIDLSTIDFNTLLSNFEGSVDLSGILNTIGTAIGVDLSDLELSTLMTKLEINENVAENGYRFTIYFGNLRLTLDVSEDFKNMTASVRELTMNNYKINMSVNSIKLDNQDFAVDETPVENEVDVSSLLEIVENAKLDDNSYALSGDIVVKYGDYELSGSVGAKLVSLDDKTLPFVRFKTNIGGVDAYVYYIDSTMYLSVEQLNFKLDLNNVDFSEIEKLLSEYGISLDMEALMAISVLMPTFENFEVEVLENSLTLTLGDEIFFDDVVSIDDTVVMLKTKTVDENILPDMLNLSTKLTVNGEVNALSAEVSNIMIGKDTQYLSDMMLNANEVISLNTKNGMTDVQTFVNLENFIDIFKEVVKTDNLSFNVSLSVGELASVSGVGKFDVESMNFNLDLNLNIDGLKLNIFLYGDTKTVYATIGEKSMKLDLNKTNLTELLTEFGVSMDTAAALDKVSTEIGIDLKNINILDVLKKLTLTESEEENILTYNISLENNKIALTYNKETKTFGLSFTKNISGYDVSVELSDVTINAEDFALTTPSGEEEDISPIFDLIDKVKLENGYAISAVAEVSVNDKIYQTRITAEILKSGEEYQPYLKLSTEIKGVKVNAYLVEDEIYLNIEQLLIALNINELNIEELTTILQDEFDLNTEAVETVTVVLPALADITIAGLENGFNVSLDKEIVVNESIKISNSDLDIVTYNDNGTMMLDYIQISTLATMNEKEYKVSIKLDDMLLGGEAENLDNFIFTDGKVSALVTNNGTASVTDFVRAENLIDIFKEVVKTNNLTFNVGLIVGELASVSGVGKFDIGSMNFNLDLNLNIDGLKLNIFLYGDTKTVYVTIGEKSMKLDLNKINLTELLTEFGVSMDTANALDKVSTEIGIDLKNFNILDVLKKLTLTESEEENILTYNISLENNKIALTYNKAQKTFGLAFTKNISGYDVNVNLSDVTINAEDFTLTTPSGEEEDISPIFDLIDKAKLENGYAISAVAEVLVNEKIYQARITAEILKSGEEYQPYLKLSTEIEGIKINAYLVEDEIYLNIEQLLFALNINELNIEELTTILQDEFDLNIEAVETITVILPALADITIAGLENGFNVSLDKEIVVNESIKISNSDLDIVTYNDNGTMMLDYIQISTLATMNEKEYKVSIKLDDMLLGGEAENLDNFIFTDGKVSALVTNNGTASVTDFVRAENLIDIFKEVVKTDNLTFNVGLIVGELASVSGVGKFDVESMNFNLDLNLNIDGLKLSIFLYGDTNTVYVTIGEKNMKIDLNKINLTELLTEFGVSMDTASVVEQVSTEIGVDLKNINILDVLKKLTLTESEEENILTYNISLENNKIALTYNKETKTFGLAFAKNISGYDVNVNLSDVTINAEDFTLTTPSGEEEDISHIFNLVDDIKIDDYTYAISGDLAVRYSTTSFYGDMLAMIVRKADEYVPYVRVYTSAMNIETYIYLLDDEIYLDLHGLRLTFNLQEETIDEILTFVSDDLKMTIAGLENLTSTFKVILPALNSISANWIEGGVQINIGDDLQYTDSAKFANIVLQAFGENTNSKIYPTKLVIGANIIDPNTDTYDSYEEWWLENEEPVTKDKNFAIYLTNVAIGKNSLFMDDMTFGEDGNVISVKGKDGIYGTDEFTSYQVLLPLVKAVYSYINSNQYQVGLSVNMGNIGVSGDALVELTDKDDENVSSSLFGGRGLKVQSDLTLTTGDVNADINNKHEISLIYDSNEKANSGLYFTYAHGNFIGTDTKFRGHIENVSMSDMISMILGITNIELSDSMMNSWDLDKSTTDFSYLHELLGITKNDVSDEITQVDSLLSDISGILKMLENISFVEDVNNYIFAVDFNMNENSGKLEILFDKEGNLASISFSLGSDLSAIIEVQEFSASNFDYDTTATHHNLSNLPEFIDTAVNTLNTKNFNFKGTVTVDIIGIITLDMNIDLYANIEDINNPYIFAQVELQTSTLASWVFNGDFDTRMVTFEFKDNSLTFNRYSITSETHRTWTDWIGKEWTKVVQDSVDRNTYSSAEIMPNLTKIILDSLGVKESFLGINLPDMIIEIINSIEANPSLEETLVAFTTDETCENMTLTLDGPSLLGDDGAQNMNVNLGTKKYAGYYKDETGAQLEKTYAFIDSITGLTIDMSSILVSLDLYSNNDADGYNTNAYQLKSSYEDNSGGIAGGYWINTNNYYRNQYMNSVIS